MKTLDPHPLKTAARARFSLNGIKKNELDQTLFEFFFRKSHEFLETFFKNRTNLFKIITMYKYIYTFQINLLRLINS